MKKLIFSIIVLCLIFSGSAFAQTPDIQQQVDQLKQKIASKVAELNLVEKRAYLGTVTDSSDTQITLETFDKVSHSIDVDELTKFSGNASTFGISDIKKGMTIGIIGLYNKESQRMQARVITQESLPPTVIYGAVYSIDSKNYEITVAKENGAQNVVEIDTVTKTSTFTAGQLTKSGFSKIAEGETLIIVGVVDKADKNKMVAERVILFPDIATNPKIDLRKNLPTVPPSTGSGVKLQPIVK